LSLINEEGKMKHYRFLIVGIRSDNSDEAVGLVSAKSHPPLQTSATFQRLMARQANGKNPVSDSAEGIAALGMLRVNLGNSRQNHHQLPAKNDAY
jgi:hypothetical protein